MICPACNIPMVDYIPADYELTISPAFEFVCNKCDMRFIRGDKREIYEDLRQDRFVRMTSDRLVGWNIITNSSYIFSSGIGKIDLPLLPFDISEDQIDRLLMLL
jgi:hypothetical protein